MKIDTIPDSVVAAPPAGVVVASFAGVPLEMWVLWLNIVYVLLAIGLKLWGVYREKKHGRK